MNGSTAEEYLNSLTGSATSVGVAEYTSLNLTVEDMTLNRMFISTATEANILSDTDLQTSNISTIISQLWSLLSNTPFRFSYRTTNRILQYLNNGLNLYRNSGITIDNNVIFKLFDSEMLLKVLPRIHGTRKLLEPLLINLLYFCNINYSINHFNLSMRGQKNADLENYLSSSFDYSNSRFPRTAIRIAKLLNEVTKTNYGSFI